MDKKIYIGSDKPRCIVVYDKSLALDNPPFIEWLRNEGFRFGGLKECNNTPYIYIDFTRKLYATGIQGVKLAPVFGEHAITIKEFKTIYDIYKKYEGQDCFVFHNNLSNTTDSD